MKMGIAGLPQCGRSTFFSLVAGKKGAVSQKGDKKVAVAQVKDKRLDNIHKYFSPVKKINATVEFLLVPPLTKDPLDRRKALSLMAEVNAVLLVVRAFKDESVYHIDTTVDPLRDVQTLLDEMVLYDLEIIERRLQNIEKDLKRTKTDPLVKEKELLLNFQKVLEEGTSLRKIELGEESEKMVRGFNFLTLKPLVILLNVADSEMKESEILKTVEVKFGSENTGILSFCATMEKEISELETEEEREAFLSDLGFDEPAIDRIIHASYETLGYISFFTIGDNEVRAWTVKKGALAPQAAGTVHSDMERGFIRAEVIKFDDFMELGGEQGCRKAGLAQLKGKDYIVQDGDIINIRFNI